MAHSVCRLMWDEVGSKRIRKAFHWCFIDIPWARAIQGCFSKVMHIVQTLLLCWQKGPSVEKIFHFFFKQKTAYEIMPSLVGSEMCIRDSNRTSYLEQFTNYHSNSIHYQHFDDTSRLIFSLATPPSTNCYHPRLRFELLLWHMARYKCRLLTYLLTYFGVVWLRWNVLCVIMLRVFFLCCYCVFFFMFIVYRHGWIKDYYKILLCCAESWACTPVWESAYLCIVSYGIVSYAEVRISFRRLSPKLPRGKSRGHRLWKSRRYKRWQIMKSWSFGESRKVGVMEFRLKQVLINWLIDTRFVGGVQAQPVSPNLVSRLLGNRVAVSPIVTIEPRRRKFHRPITLTMPLPRAAQKGMLNQYGGQTGGAQGEAPTLRLLCSIMGEWSEVTDNRWVPRNNVSPKKVSVGRGRFRHR